VSDAIMETGTRTAWFARTAKQELSGCEYRVIGKKFKKEIWKT